MKRIQQIAHLILLILFFQLVACTADKGPVFVEDPDNEITTVSFSADIQPIFNSRCIQCHDGNHVTGLNLKAATSYNLLVNVVTFGYSPNVRIKPFSEEESVLWHKINNDGVFGGIMPAQGAPLTVFQIKKIEKWIELGALND